MAATTLTSPSTLAGAWLGKSEHSTLRILLLVLAGSALIALSAQFAFRLPFGWFAPVPVTGQTFAVLVIGMAFGPKLGALTVIAYLLEGLFLPVFAEARTWSHPLTFWTAGYLVGFVLAAYATGWLAEKGWDRRPTTTALAMLVGNAAIYAPGMLWLAYAYSAKTDLAAMAILQSTVKDGFTYFIVGDLMKIALAVAAFPIAWKLVGKGK